MSQLAYLLFFLPECKSLDFLGTSLINAYDCFLGFSRLLLRDRLLLLLNYTWRYCISSFFKLLELVLLLILESKIKSVKSSLLFSSSTYFILNSSIKGLNPLDSSTSNTFPSRLNFNYFVTILIAVSSLRNPTAMSIKSSS